MPRVRKGAQTAKKRRSVLRHTKGYRWGRKSKKKAANEALMKAWTYAYRDRRARKRDFRSLWQVKINAAARENGTTYSRFISALTKSNVILDRKTLADLAENEPEAFKSVVETVGASLNGASKDGSADDEE